MVETIQARVRKYANELPSALFMGTITAVVTVMLVLLLSLTLGQESRNRQLADRCTSAYIAELLREIIVTSPTLAEGIDLDDYPSLNIRDLDCSIIFRASA